MERLYSEVINKLAALVFEIQQPGTELWSSEVGGITDSFSDFGKCSKIWIMKKEYLELVGRKKEELKKLRYQLAMCGYSLTIEHNDDKTDLEQGITHYLYLTKRG